MLKAYNEGTVRPYALVTANKVLSCFVVLHVLAWTSVAALVRCNLPLDVLESHAWSQQLEWGYDKNPFVNPWLTALVVKIIGYQPWALYGASQVAVGVCFWAVWQLGKQLLPPALALLGVLSLEGMEYYNFHALDFNDNTLELSFWALIVLFFYRALHPDNLKPAKDYLLWGFFSALGLMVKYYTLVLLIPLLWVTLYCKEYRHCWRHKYFYMAWCLVAVMILPHLVWLFQHDFITVTYAVHRLDSLRHEWWHHAYYPVQFCVAQLIAASPLLLVLLPVILWSPRKYNSVKLHLAHHESYFLYAVALGPLFITAIIAALSGAKLHEAWGQPLLSYWGLLLMLIWQPQLTEQAVTRFLYCLAVLAIIALCAYGAAVISGAQPSSANFPGQALADHVTKQWRQRYHRPLSIVAGSRWLVTNIAFYSADHPKTYLDANPKFSPWLNDDMIMTSGGVFVWFPDAHTYQDLRRRFASISQPTTLILPYLRNVHLPPVVLSLAYVPPRMSSM